MVQNSGFLSISVTNWTAQEVARWAEAISLNEETRQRLVSSGINGKELISLEPNSLKVKIPLIFIILAILRRSV